MAFWYSLAKEIAVSNVDVMSYLQCLIKISNNLTATSDGRASYSVTAAKNPGDNGNYRSSFSRTPFFSFSINERVPWAAKCERNGKEDATYSLLDIFDQGDNISVLHHRWAAYDERYSYIAHLRGEANEGVNSNPKGDLRVFKWWIALFTTSAFPEAFKIRWC